jgi:hypothetical protein
VNVLVAEEDAWAPPAMARTVRPMQKISARLKLDPPGSIAAGSLAPEPDAPCRTIDSSSEVVQKNSIGGRRSAFRAGGYGN